MPKPPNGTSPSSTLPRETHARQHRAAADAEGQHAPATGRRAVWSTPRCFVANWSMFNCDSVPSAQK